MIRLSLNLHALDAECRELSWEAATERMLDAAELQAGDWPKAASKVAEATLFSAYNAALGICCIQASACNTCTCSKVLLHTERRNCQSVVAIDVSALG